MRTAIANGSQVQWKNNTHHYWWKDAGLRKNVWLISMLYLGSFAVGFDQSLINALQSLPQWNKAMGNPSGIRLGLIVASLYFGQLACSPALHWSMDRFGRKLNITLGSLGAILGTLISCSASNEAMFIAGRVIIGMSFRFPYLASMALINEMAHPRLRGILAALYMLPYNAGAVCASVSALVCLRWDSSWSWRLPLLLQALPSVALALTSFLVPESPRWLISRQRHQEAVEILAKYHANGDCEDKLVRGEVDEITAHIQQDEGSSDHGWPSLLQTPGNRRRTLLIVLTISGSFLLGSGILRAYFTIVIRSVGVTEPAHIAAINVALNAWHLITLPVGALYVDKAGRRPMYLGTTVGLLVALSIITGISATFQSDSRQSLGIVTIVLFFIYSAVYSAGWASLFSLYPVEIMPFALRSKGLTLINVVEALCLMLTGLVDPIALKALQWRYYLVYIANIVVYLVLLWLLLVETKGRTIEQVSELFGQKIFVEG